MTENTLDIGQLYEDHQEGLSRYAISLTRSLDRADDLVQETFLKTMMHVSDLGSMNRYQRDAWLKRVLRNRFFDDERSRKRRQAQIRRLISGHRRPSNDSRFPEFESVLELVPAAHQDIFRKRYQFNMTSAEIAKDLGTPEGTVRYWLHQCINTLRAQLSQAV